jgi:hypothetical protein
MTGGVANSAPGGEGNWAAPEALDSVPHPQAPPPPMQDAAMGSSSAMRTQSGGGLTDDVYEDTNYYRESDESGVVPITAPVTDDRLAEKIVYTVSADIESLNFDETINGVYELLAFNMGFVESSYVGGRNHEARFHGWQTYRHANFTLRVPVDRLNAITANLEELGNVTSLRSDAVNITAQFTDTQARLSSLRIQEERLLDMLRRAEDVPDMIAIEERLSNVRYQVETITATLRNWQNQVDYSTLHLFIREVEIYTEVTPVQQRTYWQQIGDGLQTTTRSVGQFFMNLFKWLVINLPVLAILAVIAVIGVIIVKRKMRRLKDKSTKNDE